MGIWDGDLRRGISWPSACVCWPRFLAVVDREESIFGYATHGTAPIVGDVLEGRAWGDAVLGIADHGVVFIAADGATVLFHPRYER